MADPVGALTWQERKKLFGKDKSNDKTVFYVSGYGSPSEIPDTDCHGVTHGKAYEYGFNHSDPHFYFLNYWHAYAYALKVRGGNHD